MKLLISLIILLSSHFAYAEEERVISKPNTNPVVILDNATIQEICKNGQAYILVTAYEFTIGLSRTYKYVRAVDIEQVYINGSNGGTPQVKRCPSE